MGLFFFAIAAAAAAVASAQRPPFWGPFWTAPFNQTITEYVFQYNNTVVWSYDSTTKPVGVSLYAHGKGQHDEICTGVKNHELDDSPCNLLMSTDLWRRVIFPETGECCKACDTADYCGIVRPDWLQDNSTYQGEETIAGLDCQGWMKEGGEQNYYYAEKTTGQPCLYYEGVRRPHCERTNAPSSPHTLHSHSLHRHCSIRRCPSQVTTGASRRRSFRALPSPRRRLRRQPGAITCASSRT